jgi:hypothetical protein
MGWVANATTLLPPGKTRYPMYRRPRGPQGRSGRVRKISPQTGFDPRTVQPVAGRYTNWAIPVHACHGMGREAVSLFSVGMCEVINMAVYRLSHNLALYVVIKLSE